ncbi:hypothetical protein NQ314_006927 [Rhamnusium bicolor]|uniref:Uncharacterized protein n=1 Tax=Rhamnusium bicolor TaxID=1586634 RepID=A0AAV8YU69_9CUCU|nr:hypothetical protein NQ314_006927 [Rhamnusium bicolor]
MSFDPSVTLVLFKGEVRASMKGTRYDVEVNDFMFSSDFKFNFKCDLYIIPQIKFSFYNYLPIQKL